MGAKRKAKKQLAVEREIAKQKAEQEAKERAKAAQRARNQQRMQERAAARQARLAAMEPDQREQYLKYERWAKIAAACAVLLFVGGCIVVQATSSDKGGSDSQSQDVGYSSDDNSAAADDLDAYLSDNFSSLPWYSTYSGSEVYGSTASATISDSSYASQVCSAVSGWAYSNLNDWSIDSVEIVDPSGSVLVSRSDIGDSC